jgi:hypothetical protein
VTGCSICFQLPQILYDFLHCERIGFIFKLDMALSLNRFIAFLSLFSAIVAAPLPIRNRCWRLTKRL